jgi:xanthine dehydrogenase YagT iron-sulfur-binding subunit
MNSDDDKKTTNLGPEFTRRGFLAGIGAGAAMMAGMGKLDAAESEAVELPAGQPTSITLTINGREHKLLAEPRWTLLFVLREKLGLTGTKVGCERGECGACTVLIDGAPRYSCLTLAVEAQGSEITTIEGLADGRHLGPVQQAFVEEDAFQCGYCTPGQVVAVEGLLQQNPNPSFEEIRLGVSGNLCRCGNYNHIFKAAQRAAALKKGGGR